MAHHWRGTGRAGLSLLGPFPPEVQTYVTFTAVRGVAADSGADHLFDAPGGADVAAALSRHGLTPATAR